MARVFYTLPRLQHYREQKGMTMEELAYKAGMASSTAWKAENGSRVNASTAKRLAKVLGVKFEEIVQ